MSKLVEISIVSSLIGMEGSNPKLEMIIPNSRWAKEQEILLKSLPSGAKPGDFFEEELKGKKILSYIFEIEQDNIRNDLVSIGFAIGDGVIIEELKNIIKEFIFFLQVNDSLNLDLLKKNLPKIMTAFNKQIILKIKVNNDKTIKFDIPHILKRKKYTLQKERLTRGGLL